MDEYFWGARRAHLPGRSGDFAVIIQTILPHTPRLLHGKSEAAIYRKCSQPTYNNKTKINPTSILLQELLEFMAMYEGNAMFILKITGVCWSHVHFFLPVEGT
jgi:hypothetical protein